MCNKSNWHNKKDIAQFFFNYTAHSGSHTHDLVLHSREVPLEPEFMGDVEHSYEEVINIIKDPIYWLNFNRRLARERLNF